MATAAMQTGNCEIVSGLDLRPGRYHVRIAVHDERSGRLGSVFRQIDVPDFSKEDLWLSDPALEVEGASPSVVEARTPAAFKHVTTARTFARADRVRYIVRIFRKNPRAATALEATIVDEANRVVDRHTQAVETATFDATGVAEVTIALPTDPLPPGHYLLTVQATAAGKKIVRQTRLTIQ